MGDLSIHDRTRCNAALPGPHRVDCPRRPEFLLVPTVVRRKINQRIVEAEDTTTDCTAKRRRSSSNCVESRLQIRWGRRDDPKDFCRSGLLLERLARFVDESRVFHRQHRLGGETLQQRKLLIG